MGFLFLIIAYLFYGISDAVGPLSYKIGSNTYNLAFLNSLIPIPIIVSGLLITKQKIRISKRALAASLMLGILSAVTTLTMNLSYVMIGVGMGTMLHMSHTLVASFGEAAILKQRPGKITVLSLVVVLSGIVCMVGGQTKISFSGILLALCSGVAYGSLMLMIAHTSVNSLTPMQVQFYSLLIASAILFLYGRMTHQLTLSGLPGAAWTIHIFCAVATNFAGFLFVQLGVRRAGASAGSIIGSLEPVTSTVLGVLILKESISILKLAGCILIIAGISMEPFFSINKQKKYHD